MNPHTPELRAAVIADYQSGKTFAEIAADRNISQGTISKWLKAAGVKSRPAARRPIPDGARTCTVKGCGRLYKARGYCGLHYGRLVLGHKTREEVVEARVTERLEDCRWMADTGESLDGAAERLGLTTATLEAFLRRYDRETLARLIAHRPKDHNRMADGISISELTGQTARRRRARERSAA